MKVEGGEGMQAVLGIHTAGRKEIERSEGKLKKSRTV